MSAHVSTPATLAYGTDAVQSRAGASLAGRVAAALRWAADYPRRRAVIDELQRLSDRELADVGLVRGDLRNLFSR